MNSANTELALVAIGAMLSPTTLTFSVLALVLGERPFRTGFWFYVGALSTTLLIGVVAAFVLGDAATSSTSKPRTWVAVFDVVAGTLVILYAYRFARRPGNPATEEQATARMRKVISSSVPAIFFAGAALANPGAFIPIALKDISQKDPSAAQYVVWWVGFALVSLLPLSTALVMLVVARKPTEAALQRVQAWLERHVHTVAAVIVAAVGIVLLRNGLAGLIG
jgi:uncharacterized membrane protein